MTIIPTCQQNQRQQPQNPPTFTFELNQNQAQTVSTTRQPIKAPLWSCSYYMFPSASFSTMNSPNPSPSRASSTAFIFASRGIDASIRKLAWKRRCSRGVKVGMNKSSCTRRRGSGARRFRFWVVKLFFGVSLTFVVSPFSFPCGVVSRCRRRGKWRLCRIGFAGTNERMRERR